MTDEIIEEVWREKEELAKEFHYDLNALAEELRKRSKESGRKVVNLTKRSLAETSGVICAMCPEGALVHPAQGNALGNASQRIFFVMR